VQNEHLGKGSVRIRSGVKLFDEVRKPEKKLSNLKIKKRREQMPAGGGIVHSPKKPLLRAKWKKIRIG